MRRRQLYYRSSHDTGKTFNNNARYHSHRRPASLCSPLLGIISLLAGLDPARAADTQILASGELLFGARTAPDELPSEGEGDRGYAFFANSELYIDANVSPAESLSIGARVVLEADADIEEVNADQTYMFLSGGFGLMQLGRTEGAEDAMALGADTIATGTGGIDGDTQNLGKVKIVNSEDAAKISYFTPRLAGMQAGLSFTPDTGDIDDDEQQVDLEDHVGLGLNFVGTISDIDIGLATVGSYGNGADADQNDLEAFSVGGTLALDEIELGASYGKNKQANDFDFATVGGSVGFGKARAGLGYNYLDEKTDGITHVIVLSGDILLLEGVELLADVSYADREDQGGNTASVVAVRVSF